MKESIDRKESNNWKLTLAYDGTDFHGWQIQPGRETIQGVLAEAVAAITGEQVLPQGSGRTDAGVHARGQVASFSLAAAIPAENFQRALNRILPATIRILSAERMPTEFHARHSAVGKVYEYRIFHGAICPPWLARSVTCWRWPLDFTAMHEAAQAFLGEHDFTSFAASDPDLAARKDNDTEPLRSNVRRIEQSEWRLESIPLPEWLSLPLQDAASTMVAGFDAADSGDLKTGRAATGAAEILTYTVRGNGFLHHMVRNLVGTFLEVGRGRMTAGDMVGILHGRDRALAGPTAAANGLCLMKVLY